MVDEVDTDSGEITQVAAKVGVATWLGAVEGQNGREYARSLLMPSMQREDDPKTWLAGYLTEERASGDVKVEGGTVGYSEATLKRAAEALGVRYRYVGKRTFWRLPIDAAQDVAHAPYPRPGELRKPDISRESENDLCVPYKADKADTAHVAHVDPCRADEPYRALDEPDEARPAPSHSISTIPVPLPEKPLGRQSRDETADWARNLIDHVTTDGVAS